MINNKCHCELLRELENNAREETIWERDKLGGYIGTTKKQYFIKTPVRIKIIREWVKKHRDITPNEFSELIDSLYTGESHEELALAGKLLENMPKLRKQLNPELLDKWLDRVEGWCEVDMLCQPSFTAEEMLLNWKVWEKLIAKFSGDKNIHKRRASLVLLTMPVRHSHDNRLSDLAFANINKLKGERHVLITKAISWLLRNLIKNHREEVEKYLAENSGSLPAIAVRETARKLATGKK